VRPGGIGLAAAAVGYAAATVAIPWGDVPTAYAVTSSEAAAADLAAGYGLIAAGALTLLLRPGGSTGLVATAAGIAWLAPDWIGWHDGWAPVRSLAMVAAPFLLPLLAHLTLAFPTGRVRGRVARLAVALTYAVTTLYSVTLALVRDPFLDASCWSNCTDNSFLIRREPELADGLARWWPAFIFVAGVGLAAAAVWRLARASSTGRPALAPVLLPAALAAAAVAAHGLALVFDPSEVPEDGDFRTLFYARALALACVAVAIAWAALRAQQTRTAIARLAADLGATPAPGSLRAVLARSLGDDRLEVAYWLPGSSRYVDADGRPTEPSSARDREATPIVRNGEPVAVVVHDRSLSGAHDLEREIGAAARLAVDNERLRAEVLAQLEDLRASRSRIVETGDAARRRLERDLHDGAQQRLLALSYELRVAQTEAAATGDVEATSLLMEASEEAQAALAELRDLAHGIYPVILTEAGLAPALATFADTGPIPVELGNITDERYSTSVETAAYVTVVEAVADASQRGAGYVLVRVQQNDRRLVVDVEDDGSERVSRLTHVTDRVGALGGEVSIEPRTLRAELPCA
jgi:signal transduction histidine kinase